MGIINNNTVHQLNFVDFNSLRDSTKGNEKTKLTGQRSFEFLVMARGDGFADGYEYECNKKKVCLVCSSGHNFDISPNSYKHGSGCPKCSGQCPEQSKSKFEKIANERGDKIIGAYINNTTKIRMVCSSGHDFGITPINYKDGNGCAKCSGRCPEQSEQKFIKMANERGDKVVGEYTRNTVKLDMICSSGHIFTIIPNSYKNGHGCPKCSGQCPEQSKSKFEKIANERGDKIIGAYINNTTKIRMVCSSGHDFRVSPRGYKSGRGCPKCRVTGFKTNRVGYIYIMRSTEFKHDIIKIGISNVPDKRMYELKRGTPFAFDRIELFKFDDGQNAYDTEQLAHKMMDRYNFDFDKFAGYREWFNFNTEQIDFVRSEFERLGTKCIPDHLIE